MESLHGGTLLDWESRKTVKQIDVEVKNVVRLQSLSPCSIWFLCLGFLVWYRSLQWPIHLNNRSFIRPKLSVLFTDLLDFAFGVIIGLALDTECPRQLEAHHGVTIRVIVPQESRSKRHYPWLSGSCYYCRRCQEKRRAKIYPVFAANLMIELGQRWEFCSDAPLC